MSITVFDIRYFYHYIPTYYEGLSDEQEEEQRRVLDFKDGICSEEDMDLFVTYIQRKIDNLDPSLLPVVLFMPSTNEKAHRRKFEKLSRYLDKKLSCPVNLMTLCYIDKYKPSHLGGEKGVTDERLCISFEEFEDRYVFLVDDVYTTGKTYNAIKDFLLEWGATGVTGVMFARTIHPKELKVSPKKNKNKSFNP